MKNLIIMIILLRLLQQNQPYFNALKTGDQHSCFHSPSTRILHCWGCRSLTKLDVPTHPVDFFALGYDNTCFIQTHKVHCVGSNLNGLLMVPKHLRVSLNVLAVGMDHVCVQDDTDGLACWGVNDQGQLEVPRTGHKPKMMSAGHWHTCGLFFTHNKDLNLVRCWGLNNQGQSDTANSSDDLFVSVECAGSHSCLINSNGILSCFGRNNKNQINIPDTSKFDIKAVSAAVWQTCSINQGNELNCWGNGWESWMFKSLNQISDEVKGNSVSVASGQIHRCVILKNTDNSDNTGYEIDHVRCWGNNQYNQLNVPQLS